jgi:hypothetical protein
MALHQLRCGAQAGQRVPQPMRYRGGHFTDRGQLFRLDQLNLGAFQLGDLRFQLGIQPKEVGARLAQALPHAIESSRQVSHFVSRGDWHRML